MFQTAAYLTTCLAERRIGLFKKDGIVMTYPSVRVAVGFLGLFCVPFLQCEQVASSTQAKPRVFITDSQSWEMIGHSAGAWNQNGGGFASTNHGGARPQTAEIIKTFGERCPQVVVNNKLERADYVVVLDHEGGKGYLRRRNKIAVFNKEGDNIGSRSTRSLGNSVQDACVAIVADWSGHAALAVSDQKSAAANPSATPPPVTKSEELSAKPTLPPIPLTSTDPIQ